MLIRVGFEIGIQCGASTPMTMHLAIHPERRADIVRETGPHATPGIALEQYRDTFGNDCLRCVAPEGMFLLPSRYCETEHLSDLAWKLFGHVRPGWQRVQAVCDYVHQRLTFSYGYARATRTACQAHEERVGVCRDFAHLAVALCRCLNIPARYVNGFMGDIGVPSDPAPMDFNAWIEVFLGGRWHTFDARHNTPRIGRIVVARGRDAADISLIHTYGQHRLDIFNVWTYEVKNRMAATGHVASKHSLVDPWHSPYWVRHSRQGSYLRDHDR
jgi:transglutaminase-like putative cysteine protease